MTISSSRVSQISYVVFVCLWLIPNVGADTKTMLDYTSSYPVAASSSSSPAPQIKYDVFISFRGNNTRKVFLGHLVEAFSRKQIVAFVDDKLVIGEEIFQALVGAIQRSLISLIIFSQDYASSHWCLRELVKIIECREKDGQLLIPVFYNVHPSDVRHQKGTYEIAFAKHEERYTKLTVQMWRSALNESANLSGFHSSNFRNDALLVEEIIKWVMTRLKHMHQVNSKGLIGISKSIAHIESLLSQAHEDVRVIGVWGMGGMGKTTIVEEVFNRLCSDYEGCSFLANVREASKRHGIISLKNKLFSTLLDEKDLNIETPHGLPNYVEKRLGRMKILIVLDDVNDSEQLEILVGTRDWFGSGSRIIVTTRDKQVLAKEVNDIYEVEALNFTESLQLFNLNAFKQNHLEMEYYELSTRVVNYAKGIPLVLKVLAHLLHGKEKKIWESQLQKLKKMPNKKVHDIMRLSYDDLDRDEQKIFLDIACFFHELDMDVDLIKILLKDRDHSVAIGLERLHDKALITISEDNIVSMHDIIQEMALEIIRQESIEDPGSNSRLWDPDDIYQVLKNNKGVEAIRSISVHLSVIKELQLSPHVFAKMSKLQFLDFHGINQQHRLLLPQGLHSLPNGLRFLRWRYYPSKSLPTKFSAENLVILDLPNSQVEKLWHGVKKLVNLKSISLPYSSQLMELPDFSKATNLEIIDLRFCGRLTRVHPSIFSLDKLQVLDLSHSSVTSFQSDDIHLRSLRPLTSLKSLDASYFQLRTLLEFPPSIQRLDANGFLLPKTVLFRSISAEQRKENKQKIAFWNCLKLDKHSLEAIGFNAQINIMKFSYQQLSALQHNYYEESKVYKAKATYVYPGSKVPDWLEYRTSHDYITIDLSSAPHSTQFGFIFCLIVPKVPSYGLGLKLSISDGEGDSINVYLDRPRKEIASDHVCLIYDQRCSHYLNSRAKNQPKFKIKVTTVSQMRDSEDVPVLLKGFGVSPINPSEYHNFIQQLVLGNTTISFNKWN